MAKKFIFQAPWPDFSLDGKLLSLGHLNEYHLRVDDSRGTSREILVTFSDHCFTSKEPAEPDQSAKYLYRNSTRKPGYFCLRRYQQSLSLVGHLESAKAGRVWNASGQNFAVIPTVLENGNTAHYAILFSLRKLKGLPPYQLRMDIVSAYICDDIKRLATFGALGFKKLVTTIIEDKKPSKSHATRRRRLK